MTPEPTDVPQGGERLSAVLVACLEAMDAGQPIDRQELLARHPEHAAELAKFLDDQGHVDRLAAPLRAVAQGEGLPGQGAGPAQLGDFRIVREVGRGGMGVVYEAEQISLGRRVALKGLPFAATMDPRQLQRFQNEARAAASLEHAHIVPVYGVGCERGVHYYAMKFIDGQVLAELIAQQQPGSAERTTRYALAADDADTRPQAADATVPAPRDAAHYRRVAQWGAQAAEALEH